METRRHGERTRSRLRGLQAFGCAFGFCLLAAASAHSGDPPAMEWEKFFGGDGAQGGGAVDQTTDGGYIVAGNFRPWNPDGTLSDCGSGTLRKIDPEGQLVWEKTYASSSPCNVLFLAVQEADDGGFIVRGTLNGEVCLVKTDRDGNKIWFRAYPGGTQIITQPGRQVEQTSDGGYISLASKPNPTATSRCDVYLFKTDRAGELEWARTFGGKDSEETGYSLDQTTDGGYVLAGGTCSPVTHEWDVYLVKTDANGNEVWSRTFGGDGNQKGYSVQQTKDGGYIVAGVNPLEGWAYWYLVKTDGTGNEVWSRRVQERGQGFSVWQTHDGGYVLSGTGPALVVKTDGMGNPIWSWGKTLAQGYSVLQTRDRGYTVAGWSQALDGKWGHVYVLKLAPDAPGPFAFQRGDSDSGGALNLTDAVFTLSYLFRAGPAPGCLDAADADDNGKVQITDAILTLNHLFLGGPPLAAPAGSCGADTTEDELGCASYAACGGG